MTYANEQLGSAQRFYWVVCDHFCNLQQVINYGLVVRSSVNII